MDILSTVVLGILSTLAASLLVSAGRRYRHFLTPRRSWDSHLKELKGKIKIMPFIYEGIEAYVMEDFVGLRIQILDENSLQPVTVRSFELGSTERLRRSKKFELGSTERLRRSKKVVFLGGAGIGKTTFQRHTILSIIENRSSVDFLEEKEQPVPFLVPLKAVENTVSLPILKYILANNSVFSGLSFERGINRLLELTAKNRLFLFLDGYDEIQFTPGQRGAGFIRDELNLIMGTDPYPGQSDTPSRSTPRAFYESLKYCRVWLSCRKEFFEQHRIRIDTSDSRKAPIVSIVEIQGIADNRQNLVKKIFEKHKSQTRARALQFEDIFDSEYFVHEIDSSSEHGLKALSYNPLFLTIMCFIYARSALTEKTYDVKWASSFNELITKCIDLLLWELDQGKVSELPKARRAALEKRRGEFIPEKTDFLEYFSFALFEQDKRLFDAEYVRDQAIRFFREKSNSINASRIVHSLQEDLIDPPHIVSQLLNTGIFSLVDKVRRTALYDFPHQRFREVLASEYMLKHGYDYLLRNIDSPRLSELLYVFFNRSDAQDQILRVLLEKVKNSDDGDFLSTVLINCLRKKPIEYNPTFVIRAFLIDCLNTSCFFTLRLETLDHLKPDPDFLQFVADQFRASVNEERHRSLLLASDLLSRFEEGMFGDHVKNDLMPKFTPDNIFICAVILNRAEIEEKVRKEQLTEAQAEFFRLAKIYQLLSPVSAERNEQAVYCYIVTDEILDAVRLPILETEPKSKDGKKVAPEYFDKAAKNLRYQVFLKPDFLNARYWPLNIEPFRTLIIDKARTNYALYHQSMKTIKKALDPSYKARFFTSNS